MQRMKELKFIRLVFVWWEHPPTWLFTGDVGLWAGQSQITITSSLHTSVFVQQECFKSLDCRASQSFHCPMITRRAGNTLFNGICECSLRHSSNFYLNALCSRTGLCGDVFHNVTPAQILPVNRLGKPHVMQWQDDVGSMMLSLSDYWAFNLQRFF